jgi:transglutaminase-like putative cysteine protease
LRAKRKTPFAGDDKALSKYLQPGAARADKQDVSRARVRSPCVAAPLRWKKGRALYDHVLDRMKYDKSGTGWGRGDAQYACDVKTGNCTDFHAYFIALARSIGIPARFAIGFTIPAETNEGRITGYHCWADFMPTANGCR